LRSRAEQQAAVAHLSKLANQCDANGALFQHAIDTLRETLDVDCAAIFYLMPDEITLQMIAAQGFETHEIGNLTLPSSERNPFGFAVKSREPVVISDVDKDNYFQAMDFLANHNILSSATVLLDDSERPFGVLGAFSHEPRTYSTNDRAFLLSVAEIVSVAAARQRQTDMLMLQTELHERIAQGEILRPILNELCHRTESMIPGSTAAILLFEEKSHRIRLGAGPNVRPELANLLDNLEPGHATDVEEFARKFGTRACWSTPIFVDKGKVVGTFAILHSTDAQPASHELQILDAVSRLAACAVRSEKDRRLLKRAEQSANDTESKLHQQMTELVRASDQLQNEVLRRKRAEDLARGGEQKYRDLFENSSDLIQIIEPDGDLRFVNRAWRQTLGYVASEVTQLKSDDMVHPDSRATFKQLCRQALAGENSGSVELKLYTREGKMILVEGSLNGFIEHGRIVAVRGIFRDITERKRAQEEQQKFVSLVQCASDFIGMASLEGQMFFINAEGRRLIGLAQNASLSGVQMKDLHTPETWYTLESVALPAIRAVDRWEGEGHLRHLTNRLQIDVHINTFLVRHPQTDEPMCIAIAMRDITHRKEVDRMKDELVATVSHELRTPLTSLRGYAELLLSRQFPQEKQEKFLKIIHDETLRLNKLINDFLDIRRMEAGRQSYDFASLDLIPVVSEAIHRFKQDRSKTFDWHLDLPNELPRVYADRDRIWQVLTNLISNAMKFSPDGSQVTIAAKQKGSSIVVSVADQGVGIAKADQARLFDKFYRAMQTDDKHHQGSGLGLAIVKEIVDAHEGRVWLESSIGQGSTFYFSLPILSKEE